MTTCLTEAPRADQPITHWSQCTCGGRLRPCLVASEDQLGPGTGRNSCPSDSTQQAACPEC